MWSMPMADVHAVLGSGERSLREMPLDDARSPGVFKGGMMRQSRAGPWHEIKNIHPDENLLHPFRDILIRGLVITHAVLDKDLLPYHVAGSGHDERATPTATRPPQPWRAAATAASGSPMLKTCDVRWRRKERPLPGVRTRPVRACLRGRRV